MKMLPYKKKVEKILYGLKRRKDVGVPAFIETPLPKRGKLKLKVITDEHVFNDRQIKRLALWREKASVWFPSQFTVTIEGTRKWAKEMLLEKPDRILFFMYLDDDDEPFGHIGLYRFNYVERTAEIDNVIRGETKKGTVGAMTVGLQALIHWAFVYLGIKDLYLQVFSDNTKARLLYKRLGFSEIKRIPLINRKEKDISIWEEIPQEKVSDSVFRYNIKMKLQRTV